MSQSSLSLMLLRHHHT